MTQKRKGRKERERERTGENNFVIAMMKYKYFGSQFRGPGTL